MAASRSQFVMLAAAAAVLAMATLAVLADPDIVTDFVVPPNVSYDSITGSFFTYQGLREGVITVGGFGANKVAQEQLPSLTGLGVSTALLSYDPSGTNPPHTHPRGTEVLLVLSGSLQVGLVDTTNKLFTSELFPGDIFVFPKGLVHYQYNAGNTSTLAYSAFSSSNPGTVSLPKTLFSTKIDDVVLEKGFKVTWDVIEQLKAPFQVSPPAPSPLAQPPVIPPVPTK